MDAHHNPEFSPQNSPSESRSDIWQLLSLPEHSLPIAALAMRQYLMNAMSGAFLGFRGDVVPSDNLSNESVILNSDQKVFNRMEDFLSELFNDARRNGESGLDLELVARCTYLNPLGERRYIAMFSATDTEGNSLVFNIKGEGILRYKNFIALLVESGDSLLDRNKVSLAYSQAAFDEAIVDICLNWREHFRFASAITIPMLDEILSKIKAYDKALREIDTVDALSCFEGAEGYRYFRIAIEDKTFLVSVDREPLDCTLVVEVFNFIPSVHLVSLNPLTIVGNEDAAPRLIRESLVKAGEDELFYRAAQTLGNHRELPRQSRNLRDYHAIKNWLAGSERSGREFFDSIDKIDIRSISQATRLGKEHRTTLLFAIDTQQRHLLHTNRTHGSYEWGAVGMLLKSINDNVLEAHPIYTAEAFAEELGRSLSIVPEDIDSLRAESYILDRVISTVSENKYARQMVKDMDVTLKNDWAMYHLRLAWEVRRVEVMRDYQTGTISLVEHD